ncbi:hypothetical protein KDM41_05675 [bacterium]|nr:hypothetical protein [bacterium]
MTIRQPAIYVICLFAAAGLFGMGSGPGAPGDPAPAVAAAPADLPPLTGTWAGSWSDTVYNVSGALQILIWAEGNAYAATGTIDVSQISAPLGVLAGGATGTDNGSTLEVAFGCTNLGNGTVTLTPTGQPGEATASGAGTVTAPLWFGAFTLTGTASGNELTGSFDFTSPGGGKGIASLTKASVGVESASWGSVKAAYSGR